MPLGRLVAIPLEAMWAAPLVGLLGAELAVMLWGTLSGLDMHTRRFLLSSTPMVLAQPRCNSR